MKTEKKETKTGCIHRQSDKLKLIEHLLIINSNHNNILIIITSK